mgnify:CR=1 FL=1
MCHSATDFLHKGGGSVLFVLCSVGVVGLSFAHVRKFQQSFCVQARVTCVKSFQATPGRELQLSIEHGA